MTSTAPAGGPREAGSPFDAPDADIILRSIDGVDFRTYKSYLTRALHGFDELLVRLTHHAPPRMTSPHTELYSSMSAI